MNKQTGEVVAVKVLNLDTADDDMADIQREIAVLSHCDSEYITRYHGSFLVDTRLWIVVDYAGGGSIRMLVSAMFTNATRQLGTC
jgi:serine/threonine protein kinase